MRAGVTSTSAQAVRQHNPHMLYVLTAITWLAIAYMVFWNYRSQQMFATLPLQAKFHPRAKPLILRWPLLGIGLALLIVVHLLVEFTTWIPHREQVSTAIFSCYLALAVFQLWFTRRDHKEAVFPERYTKAVRRSNVGDVLLSSALLVEAVATPQFG